MEWGSDDSRSCQEKMEEETWGIVAQEEELPGEDSMTDSPTLPLITINCHGCGRTVYIGVPPASGNPADIVKDLPKKCESCGVEFKGAMSMATPEELERAKAAKTEESKTTEGPEKSNAEVKQAVTQLPPTPPAPTEEDDAEGMMDLVKSVMKSDVGRDFMGQFQERGEIIEQLKLQVSDLQQQVVHLAYYLCPCAGHAKKRSTAVTNANISAGTIQKK